MAVSRRSFLCFTTGLLATTMGGKAVSVSAQDAATTPEALATDLIVFGDIVQGGKNIPEDQAADRSCVLSSRFPRNSEIVWRVRVVDPETRQPMDDSMLQKVEVALSDGQTFEMDYGAHPPPPRPAKDYYWTVPWVVPMDYPTGTFSYTVTATDTQGRVGQFKPFDLAPSLPAITDQVFETVED